MVEISKSKLEKLLREFYVHGKNDAPEYWFEEKLSEVLKKL